MAFLLASMAFVAWPQTLVEIPEIQVAEMTKIR